MPARTTDTREVMETFVEMTNERDYERIHDVFADSFRWETPAAPGGEVHSHEGAEETIQTIVSGFPDFRAELTEVVTSGATGMAEVRFTMTHEGEYEGMPPTGREVELLGMSKWTVADGQIEELRDCVNMQSLLEQLGVTGEAEPG